MYILQQTRLLGTFGLFVQQFDISLPMEFTLAHSTLVLPNFNLGFMPKIYSRFYICRPTSKEWVKLSNPRTRYHSKGFALIGHGFSPHHYKILQLCWLHFSRSNLVSELFDSVKWNWRWCGETCLDATHYLGLEGPFSVGRSGECRTKSESRWRQIDAKRTPCDARAAFSEGICKTADFPACCTGTRLCCTGTKPARGNACCTGTRVFCTVQATRTDSAALGLAPVPVQEPVYRYKGVGRGQNRCWWKSPVGDFVADVAPRAVRARLLPELCEEAGRGSVFTVLDVALRFDAVEVARSPRRNVGSRRGLVRWIRDFERNPRSPHLPDLVKLVHRTWRSPVDPAEVVLVRGFVRCLDLAFEVGYIGFTPNLIELDRDTLHTRWVAPTSATPESGLCFRVGVAHASWTCSPRTSHCGGSWTVATGQDGCIHSPGDGYAYSPDWIGSDLTFLQLLLPFVFAEPQVSAAAPSADQDRGKAASPYLPQQSPGPWLRGCSCKSPAAASSSSTAAVLQPALEIPRVRDAVGDVGRDSRPQGAAGVPRGHLPTTSSPLASSPTSWRPWSSSTVDVMRERVEFLHASASASTTSTPTRWPRLLRPQERGARPRLPREARRPPRPPRGLAPRLPPVLHASVVADLAPVVKSLRGLDVERQDVPYVLQRYPELLGFKPEGTISTSVAYLYPFFLGMRVGTALKPLVDYLDSLGLPKRILARIIEKRAYVLGYDLEETVKPNVQALLSFGVRKEALPSVIAQFPQILGLPLKAKALRPAVFSA
uniref:Mitochondrial transcription termination factor family protein n=1 Tax=Ananas comosus var. bracteatus TaxID=296719 RepID=A0A6V7P904_ANACO|nr:unnamed protein product [Ananas comosus var. bracteatus]